MASPERSRRGLDALLDLVVYAPIGAFFHGPEVVDELAAKGRTQVANARLLGKFAVDKGRAEAARVGETALDQLSGLLDAVARAAGAPLAGAPRDETSTAGRFTDGEAEGVSAEPESPTPPTLRVVSDDAPSAADLPIPDYDNLSASQVVPRLDSLSEGELAAVREYERAHRGRMTILSRIAQLEAS